MTCARSVIRSSSALHSRGERDLVPTALHWIRDCQNVLYRRRIRYAQTERLLYRHDQRRPTRAQPRAHQLDHLARATAVAVTLFQTPPDLV